MASLPWKKSRVLIILTLPQNNAEEQTRIGTNPEESPRIDDAESAEKPRAQRNHLYFFFSAPSASLRPLRDKMKIRADSLLLFQLPQSHPERPKLLLDLIQARLAEILAAEQFVFR